MPHAFPTHLLHHGPFLFNARFFLKNPFFLSNNVTFHDMAHIKSGIYLRRTARKSDNLCQSQTYTSCASQSTAHTCKVDLSILHKKLIIGKMTTTLIDIDTYTKKFEEYPSDFTAFAKEHDLTLLPLTSMRGQALALMSQPEVRGQKHIGRDEADKFFLNIGMATTDAIQQFNKATGIKRLKMRGYYCLQYPFVADTTDLVKRKGASISGDKNAIIDSIKEWWRTHLVDVPNDEWQTGHLDPTIGDASEKNLAYQPPIQGKYRDRFKFDEYFLKMWPTAHELCAKMHEYYTEKEQMMIFAYFMQKFGK